MTQEGLELRLSILKVTRGCAVLTNSSPLAQKAKESLKSSSVKVKLNKRFFVFNFKRSAFILPFWADKTWLPGGKFNSLMKIFHFSMWLVCISIDTSIEIFVEGSLEFF